MTNTLLYNQLLEQVVGKNPELAQYSEMFQGLMQDNAEPDEVPQKVFDLENRVRKLSSIAQKLKHERDDLLDDMDDFAKALGACDECWGEDNRCPCCRGKGTSGYFQPDKTLFNKLILPALKEVSWLHIQEKE
jgi:hypothetical protein